MAVVDVKDIELDKQCKPAADDAWGQHADDKPNSLADEKQSLEHHDDQQQSEPVLPHHHVVDLFDLSEYDDREYCGTYYCSCSAQYYCYYTVVHYTVVLLLHMQ